MRKLLLSVVALAIVSAVYIGTAKANSSRIITPVGCTTSGTLATTSVSYMSAGVGTSTITCDLEYIASAYGNGSNSFDSAILGIQLNASSTNTTLAWKYEYSQNKLDWYEDDVELTINATTTTHVRTYKEHSWLFASSSYPTSIANSSRSTKKVNLETPTKWIRVTFYMPTGSTGGALWAQIIGKSERI